jgi:hypothetical protein
MCHRKYVLFKEATYCDVAISFLVGVKLVDLDYQTLADACLSISTLVHTSLIPQLELGVLYGWICHMFTVSMTVLILRHTVPFILTCVMQYSLLYGCSYLLSLLFFSMTKSPTW